ncbi:hypothetical protein [Gordonia sp. (in: high G+C Gram-positive bacteria)]|nr:hypothetical protein [Gordonia sp. (in: high G+C Gram-positive bacteria)]
MSRVSVCRSVDTGALPEVVVVALSETACVTGDVRVGVTLVGVADPDG